MPRPEVTRDALFDGALSLLQPRVGYRANVDALLLAAFSATGRSARLAVDLGAGVGTIGLVLAHLGVARRVVLLEGQPALVALAQNNVAENGVAGEVELCDLERQGLPRALAQRADLVVCNPPFYPPSAGTPARQARTSRSGELAPFIRAARQALSGPRTRATFCYPAGALAELLACAHDARLVPKRLRLVHAQADAPARLALVELRIAKAGGLVIDPPLFEWARPRVRSPELDRIVRGQFARP